jgi:putative membrane protein insertion efficiency factor
MEILENKAHPGPSARGARLPVGQGSAFGGDPGSIRSKIPAFAGMVSRMLAYPLRLLIWVYQHTLSPDHGPLRVFYPYGYCKFYPTCSEYAEQTLKYSGFVGIPTVIKRLIRCRPGTAGGIDLPHKHGKHI